MGVHKISFDDKTESWLHEQADGDVDGYVNSLVQRDQRRKAAEAELRHMLDKAEASGISKRTPQEIMADVKARLIADGRI